MPVSAECAAALLSLRYPSIYILKLSYTSWRTLCLLILFEWKITLLIVPIFSEQPTCVQIRAVYSNKNYKIIEVTIVQTMLWSWSLPDWMVVRYARLVAFFDSSEATVCWFALDSRVRKYVRSSLHSLSSMTERFWLSSTERNREFGEHILLLCIQRLK